LALLWSAFSMTVPHGSSDFELAEAQTLDAD
jgi:hypothetical protein